MCTAVDNSIKIDEKTDRPPWDLKQKHSCGAPYVWS